MHECQMHESAWFLTLTYADDKIPEYGSLYPEHLSVLFKALRKRERQTARFRGRRARPISYFACGEYGERTKRPHYHAVLFGAEFLDKRVFRVAGGNRVWRSRALEARWTHGFSEFGTVTEASASYVAGYVKKKVSKKVNPDAYVRVDDWTGELVKIHPEFSRMSLKPAIGKRWIEKYWQEVYPRDRVVVEGREYRPPRYYDKWMDDNHPEVMLEVREKRYEEAVDLSPEKLRAKEEIHRVRSGLFERRHKV